MSLSSIIAFAFLLLLVIIFLWRLLINKNKEKTTVFPTAWRPILDEKVAFYHQLTGQEKVRFEKSILHFLDEVRITGVGTEVDDTDKLLVASSAVIPLFGFPGWSYSKLNEVIMYEGPFNRDFETKQGEEREILGMVGGGMNSTMVLSKPALRQGFENKQSSQNVGIHEFVHLLDRADGAVDGIPEALAQQPFLIPWMKMIHRKIKEIQTGASDIDPYGSTNEGEFLSVVSEYFFKRPDLLEKRHPELFAMLEKIFRQSP